MLGYVCVNVCDDFNDSCSDLRGGVHAQKKLVAIERNLQCCSYCVWEE